MESHVLNTYHQARYRIHSLPRMGSTSESSSDSGCNQPSPDYQNKYSAHANVFTHKVSIYANKENNDGNKRKRRKGHGGKVKMPTQQVSPYDSSDICDSDGSSPNSDSSDEDEHEEAVEKDTNCQQYIIDDQIYTEEQLVVNSDDDYEVTVDDNQYMEVYAVDPTARLSSDDEEEPKEDYCIATNHEDENDVCYHSDGEYVENEECQPSSETTDSLHLDTHLNTDIDEYYVKEVKDKVTEDSDDIIKKRDVNDTKVKNSKSNRMTKKNVFSDVDEYLLKATKTSTPISEKGKLIGVAKHSSFDEDLKSGNLIVPQMMHDTDYKKKVETVDSAVIPDNVSIPVHTEVHRSHISVTDPDILPHIEHIKKFLLEGLPDTKTQTKPCSTQRSCSLPHSPSHLPCLGLNESKNSISFEDLNLTELGEFSIDDYIIKKTDSNFPISQFATSIDIKTEDVPKILTDAEVDSFFVKSDTSLLKTTSLNNDTCEEDDLSHQDMEIEHPVETKIQYPSPVVKVKEETQESDKSFKEQNLPKSNILDFCIEKKVNNAPNKSDVKVEQEDFVDIESYTETAIPVLEANNLNSLLEQFEATEKLNKDRKPKRCPIKTEELAPKAKITNGLTNGMRLHDAAAQLNKNKLRQFMMPTTSIKSTTSKTSSDQSVHSDHDYCSPEKKHTITASIKGGQSLLKPEVLSSNNRILNSRHRSCKNRKIVYEISSDEESGTNNKKNKQNVKQSVKTSQLHSNHRKKLSSENHLSSISSKDKSVILNNASKASDNDSQSSSGSIKLTIRNKSKVILNINCDDKKDSHKLKLVNNSASVNVKCNNKSPDISNRNSEASTNDKRSIDKPSTDKPSIVTCNQVVNIKEEPRPVNDFYTDLFDDKNDVQIPQPKLSHIETENKLTEITENPIVKQENIENMQPPKKKLNLQEYKLRREAANSNSSSRTVSPEAIFPDLTSINLTKEQAIDIQIKSQTGMQNSATAPEPCKEEKPVTKIFDPISEASRKILLNSQKKKDRRNRYEDIVMTKIPKVESLELQPLMSEAELIKIVGHAAVSSPPAVPLPVALERPRSADYEEIAMVSVGINTRFKISEIPTKSIAPKPQKKKVSSSHESKSLINFKIKKSDSISKQNVFDPKKGRVSPNQGDKSDRQKSTNDIPIKEGKIDKERFKDITATIKSVEKKVDVKISSNSLFASIQDAVMKQAPNKHENTRKGHNGERKASSSASTSKCQESGHAKKKVNTVIVREYDAKADHGEDKVILHLEKNRIKPKTVTIATQTEPDPEFGDLKIFNTQVTESNRSNIDNEKVLSKKRCDSQMSLSSNSSHSDDNRGRASKNEPSTSKCVSKTNEKKVEENRRESAIRSRSKERYDKYRRRSRSRSRRSRRRSHSRSRSRSVDHYRSHYRRSDSPYRRRKRSRSPYQTSRRGSRSHSRRREYRSHQRSRSKPPRRSRSPALKKLKPSPETRVPERKLEKHDDKFQQNKSALTATPPLRKPTVSESSDTSVSTSSSSSSSSSDSRSDSSTSSEDSRRSTKRRRPSPAYSNWNRPRHGSYNRSYSSEEREYNTPVEERRIVFVGKLEQDITKSSLRGMFSKYGPIINITLHSKEDGTRYGFLTYRQARDAWSAVEDGGSFPQYDVGFGGRRAFCRQRYADLDGLEVEYTESAYRGQQLLTRRHHDRMSFEQMLIDIKDKMIHRDLKGDKP